MRFTRAIASLFFCCIAGGCESATYIDPPVAEYKPASELTAYRQYDAAVVSLWRWEPNDSPMVKAAMAAQHESGPLELPVEIQRVSVGEDARVGFEKINGRLFAVAGDKRIALNEGHYSWHILTQDPRLPVAEPVVVNFGGQASVTMVEPCGPSHDTVPGIPYPVATAR